LLGANSDEGISFGPRGLNTSDQFVAALEAGTISPGPALPAALSVQLAQTYLSTNICETPPLTLNTATTCPAAPAALGAIYRYTSAYAGDGVFIANRRLQCQTWAAAGVDAYCYRFNAQPYGNTIYSGVPHFQGMFSPFPSLFSQRYSLCRIQLTASLSRNRIRLRQHRRHRLRPGGARPVHRQTGLLLLARGPDVQIMGLLHLLRLSQRLARTGRLRLRRLAGVQRRGADEHCLGCECHGTGVRGAGYVEGGGDCVD